MPPAGDVTAFNVVDCPVQIVASLMEIVGVGATVVVMNAVLEQPCALVTVTVNVPAAVIVALALDPKPLSHEYEVPPPAVTSITGALQSIMVVPVLFVIVAVGVGLTVTCVVALTDPQFELMVAG